MTPILILGTGITALGAMRICARAGIPAFGMPGSRGVERHSRWYRPARSGESRDPHGPRLEDFLQSCGLPSAVLLPCSDVWLHETAALGGELSRRFPASIASPEAIRSLVDKSAFASLLMKLGVPHPVTRMLSGPDDLSSVPDHVLPGAFLKPHDSHAFFARYGVKALRIQSRSQALQRLAELRQDRLQVLLQEYIPGPSSSHYLVDGFIDAGGAIRALFARRRLRMHPRDFGNSSCMVSIPTAEVAQAIDALSAVLADLRYRGIFSAEFKQDPRDGLYKLLEINARPWWYIEFAARSGVDVCSMAYRDALGMPIVSSGEPRVGTRLVYPYYDFFACKEAWEAGEMTLAQWARSWIGAQQPLFNWTDPGPAWMEFRDVSARRLRRWVGHATD